MVRNAQTLNDELLAPWAIVVTPWLRSALATVIRSSKVVGTFRPYFERIALFTYRPVTSDWYGRPYCRPPLRNPESMLSGKFFRVLVSSRIGPRSSKSPLFAIGS